jgi:diguanylate cyclase (GGDEF)-like protein/PAS domain S-box-containing protein
VALESALAPNEPASRPVVRRDAVLLVLAGMLAVSAVVLDHVELDAHVVETPWPRLLAAGCGLVASVAVLLALWDRSRRETRRRRAFCALAIGAFLLLAGQGVGYLLTAGRPGVFDLRVEIVPLLVVMPLALYAALAIAWPSGMSRTDIRVAALDSAITVLGLGIVWWQAVVPLWKGVPEYAGWERFDQALMFVAFCVVLLIGVVSRRIGSLPLVQLDLLLGGLLTYLLSDLAGQLVAGADDRTTVAASIVGVVVAAWLIAGFAHHRPIELETARDRRGREWRSTATPLVMALLAGCVIIRDAMAAGELDARVGLAAGCMWVLLLVSVLFVRLRATFQLWDAQSGSVERVLAERTREGWFRALVGDATEYVFVLESDGRLLYVGPRVERDIALHDEPTLFDPSHGHTFAEVVQDGDAQQIRLLLAQVTLDPQRAGPHELRLRGHGGAILDVEAMIRPVTDVEFQGYVVTARDVTDTRRLQRQLESSSLVDSLTRLRSRESFLAETQHQLDGDDPEARTAVVVLDLDRFGALNETLGHDRGDEVLLAVAESFSLLPEELQAASRIASDTFAWLVVGPDPDQAVGASVERARVELRGLILRDGTEVEVTFRAGFVVATSDQLRPADWYLEAADLALARSRASRHALLVEYHEEMRAETVRRIAAERDLRQGLAQDRFEVHYQPIVCLADGIVHGAEALVRLRGTDGRLVPPVEFIAVAEEIGLIGDIGLVVLERACRQTVEASALLGRPMHISVNVSPDQLHPELVEEVRRCLATTGLQAQQLTLEITEETLADRSPRTQRVLNDLRALGLTVSLDDFGTGYSSMSYLATLPVDGLKIDRSFVSVMGSSATGLTLSRLVVQLAASLDLRTVAEGVETVEQADLLRGMGCQFGQGYLWSRPVPFADYLELLRGPAIDVGAPV